MQNIIYIHGLESSGKAFKGQRLQKWLPGCLTPDFEAYKPSISIKHILEIRMKQLNSIMKEKSPWIIIGSSFGGLMAVRFTSQNPEKVSKLILLAPYLSSTKLNPKIDSKLKIPVIVYHGKHDKIVSPTQSKIFAEKLFFNLQYNIVDDDHSLHKTFLSLDWKNLITTN
ncbi:MAG: alpha/beta fold hydrolase [Candidatus Hermodarchaeota archaeon]